MDRAVFCVRVRQCLRALQKAQKRIRAKIRSNTSEIRNVATRNTSLDFEVTKTCMSEKICRIFSWVEQSTDSRPTFRSYSVQIQRKHSYSGRMGEFLQHYVWTQPLLPTVNKRLRNLIDFPSTAFCELLTKRQKQLHSVAEKELRQLMINIFYSDKETRNKTLEATGWP